MSKKVGTLFGFEIRTNEDMPSGEGLVLGPGVVDRRLIEHVRSGRREIVERVRPDRAVLIRGPGSNGSASGHE